MTNKLPMYIVTDKHDDRTYRATEASAMKIVVGYLKAYEQARLTDGWYWWIETAPDAPIAPRGTYESNLTEPFASENDAWGEARDFADPPHLQLHSLIKYCD